MRIILYEVGKEPVVKEIANELNPMKQIVGGWIETFSQPDGIILVCNEEGKLIGLPMNRVMFNEPIAGNFFLCRSDGEEFADVTDDDIKQYV